MKKQTNATGYRFDIGKAALSAFFVAEIVLYICFLRIDIFPGGSYELSAKLKYAGILLCVLCAIIRACRLRNRTAYLVAAAILFTAVSDYFLLFGDEYLPGVLSFCVTQTLYLIVILRGFMFNDNNPVSVSGVDGREDLERNLRGCGRYRKFGVILFTVGLIVTAAVSAILANGSVRIDSVSDMALIAAAVFYAYSFIRNIVMSVILCARQSKIRPADRKNGEHESAEAVMCADAEKRELRVALFTVGVIVFALCDINVLLYNLPDYIDIRSHFILSLLDFAGNAMWAFYLPSQVTIAVSPKR